MWSETKGTMRAVLMTGQSTDIDNQTRIRSECLDPPPPSFFHVVCWHKRNSFVPAKAASLAARTATIVRSLSFWQTIQTSWLWIEDWLWNWNCVSWKHENRKPSFTHKQQRQTSYISKMKREVEETSTCSLFGHISGDVISALVIIPSLGNKLSLGGIYLILVTLNTFARVD